MQKKMKEAAEKQKKKTKEDDKRYQERFKQWKQGINVPEDDASDEKGPEPFKLEDMDFKVAEGSFVAIVGRVSALMPG